MKKFNAYFYKITCITDLHVGSGDANYNVVDNEVERDPVRGYPIIQSSGLKGALREHFKKQWNSDFRVVEVFGSDPGKSDKDTTSPGNFRFINAILGARPVRVSEGEKSSILATTADQLEDIFSLARALQISSINGIPADPAQVSVSVGEQEFMAPDGYTGIEGFSVADTRESNFENICGLFGQDCAVGGIKAMKDITLPVIAHNYLVSGVSKNLWYEEFVPRGSVFFFAVMVPDDMLERYGEFHEELVSCPVQIGANASLGYGLCSFELIS